MTSAVDEVDVNRVKVGQTEGIASDAFPNNKVTGKIVSASAETTGREASGPTPAFEVRASFAIDDEALRQVIRIGMSALVTVEA